MQVPREELDSALAVLEPDIKGLRALLLLPLTGPTKTEVQLVLTEHEERQSRLQAALQALNAYEMRSEELVTDGHPDLPVLPVAGPVYDELQMWNVAIDDALADFSKAQAVSMSVSLGAPEQKP